MSKSGNARSFFHAVDSAAGWQACRQYIAEGASFTAQSEPLADVKTVKDYVDWMAAFGTTPVPGCTYELHTS